MRLFHRLLLGLFIALAASATASAEIYEVGKDRPGGDYNALSGTPGPVQCAAACAGDPACKAWTWVNPGIQGPDPVCYLKSPAPAVKSNFCCTSGVKLVGPLPPGAAPGRDRPGSDYSSFNLPNANPGACANACNGDLNCKAWTYVNPGIKGPQARCFLKDAIPAEVAADCCVSGAKLPPPPPPLPPGAQNNRDRFGSDYASFLVPSGKAMDCYNACQGDSNCRAWSLLKGPPARCFLKNPAPPPTVNSCCISGAKALPPPPPPLPPGAQDNRDRFGSDYASFLVPSGKAMDCFNACQGDANCKAWSLLKGPPARCFLKNPAPPPTVNNCCISGAKAAPPPPPPETGGPFEINVARPGGDYIDFASGGANTALLCLGACQTQPACKAWTYVKPGFEGPQSHCYLKTIVPPAEISNCCVSGVKQ
ncbi:MAG: PAN domain-containing protein [Rhizobiales bacterium]|nr:PAN domain-containing protein [Hyphomicrobiales bacterium]